MEAYVFDVILITLAIIVVLHLVYNSRQNGSENMDNIESKRCRNNDQPTRSYNDGVYRDPGTVGLDRTDRSKPWYHYVNRLVDSETRDDINSKAIDALLKESKSNRSKDRKRCRIVFGDIYDGRQPAKTIDSESDEIDLRREMPTSMEGRFVDVLGNVCSPDDDALDVKKYIQEHVLDGKTECGCVVDKSKSLFTRDEVDEYREQNIQFADKINGTSAPIEDPVDRMNMIKLQGGIKAKGQTIADFYDNLVNTRNTYDTRVSNLNGPDYVTGGPVPKNRSISQPSIDISAIPVGFYTQRGNDGRYMMSDNWRYENDNPNNGGYFYEDVQGQDPMMDDSRML